MSTRIYNAFRLKQPFDTLWDEIKGWKKEAKEYSNNMRDKAMSERATHELDRWWLKKAGIFPLTSSDEEGKSLLNADNAAMFQVWKSIREEKEQAKKEDRISPYDWSLEASLFKVSKTTWLIMGFSSSRPMQDWLKKKILALGGEDYEYWDNTDRPEEVSASQWASRRGVWNKIFQDSGAWIPQEAGINVTLSSDNKLFLMPTIEAMAEHQPSKAERVQNQWFDLGLEIIVRKAQETNPSIDLLKLIWGAQREVKEGEWDKNGKYRAQIEKALMDTYTPECFTEMDKVEIFFEQHHLKQVLDPGQSLPKVRL